LGDHLNYRRWLIVGYMLALMVFTVSVLLIPGQKYDTLTTSDSGWVYDIAVEIDNNNALVKNNPLSHAPYGNPISLNEQVQPLLTVMLYRGISAVNPSVTLMNVVMYWAPLIFALSLIPIFLIGKELGGDVGGITAAFFAATMVSTIYWNKVGAYDREPVQLILGAWAMYLTIKLFRAPKSSIPKFALLTGMVYGLFGLAWSGWHYIIAVVILGLLSVLLVGFLGKFLRKTSDISGAFLSAIRGHLDLLIGIAGMAAVITLVMWALGGQGPEFWVSIFGTYAGYLGIGGGAAGVSFSSYASEMQAPSSWGDTLGKFYGSDILTAFILALIVLAFLKFSWSRKRWEFLTFAWLVVLVAMVLPGKGQARFERLWWPFVPALAGAGVAALVPLVQRLSLDPSGEWLKHLQNPIALLLVGGIVVAPFIANTYTTAYQTAPPTEWRGISGLDNGFMEAFDWLRDNTAKNSVVSIQWSFGHLLTGAAQRATVCDGSQTMAEEGTWESDPSFVPRPPDYIYRVEDSRGLIYGVDVSRRAYQVNGRRVDVQWLPFMGEDEFRWIIQTYRDNYGVKIDYVIFSLDEYSDAYNYYYFTQPINILLGAEKIKTSSLQPSTEDQNYVFNFGENRAAVVLDMQTASVYLRTDNGNLSMDGYGILTVDDAGNISYDPTTGFNPSYYTPDIQETLLIFLDSSGNLVSAWLIKGVSAEMSERPIPMGMRAFAGAMGDIDYLQTAFTSSNSTVMIIEINHVPHLISPENGIFTSDNTPDFTWGAVGASRYELLVDDDPSFSSPLIHEDNITSTTYTATVALQDGEYYWRVAAYGSMNNLLGWSDSSTFTLDTVSPEAPVLYAPASGMETGNNTPKFDWSLSPGADNYHLIVDNDNTFGSPVIDIWLVENTYTPTTELPTGNYYWKVTAKDAAGNENESSVWTFGIVSPGG